MQKACGEEGHGIQRAMTNEVYFGEGIAAGAGTAAGA